MLDNVENLKDNLLWEDQHLDVLELVEPREDLLHGLRLRLLGHGADADHHFLTPAIAVRVQRLAQIQLALLFNAYTKYFKLFSNKSCMKLQQLIKTNSMLEE